MDNRETNPESTDMGQTTVTAEGRHQLIAKAAYSRAERRGFIPGSELEDWLEAEAEIDRMLGKSRTDYESKEE